MAQVTITGEVVYVHAKFIAVKEEGERGKRWQVWATGPQKGEQVTITGELKTKVGEPYAGNDGVERVGVDHAINNAVIAPQNGAQAPQSAQEPEWVTAGASGGYDTETPF